MKTDINIFVNFVWFFDAGLAQVMEIHFQSRHEAAYSEWTEATSMGYVSTKYFQ